MAYQAYSVSWNLTQRCNLFCTHCYMSAFPNADISQDLTTKECFKVMDGIEKVNPNVFLILTGGEPLVRKDIFDIAAYGSDKGFTCVLGTNGVLIGRTEARKMRESGLQGASISLDSVDPKKHDEFRGLAHSWKNAIRGMEFLQGEGLDFSIHMSVMSWNVSEIPKMIELSKKVGAKVLNFFFLIQTGRGENLIDIQPSQYREILTYLARAQGVGPKEVTNGGGLLGQFDDPWTSPAGESYGLILRAKCAPHFRKIIYELDPDSPLLKNYSQGSCPAGKYYCRITPEGDITPCPYMPVSAGNLREKSFDEIWNTSPVLNDLRDPQLGGRCGDCEFSEMCGGCRCRAYAATGDYLAEDPACDYQPGQYGGKKIQLTADQTFGLEVKFTMDWSVASKERLKGLPSFARGMVARGVERYAAENNITLITPEVMQIVREKAEAKRGRSFSFTEFSRSVPVKTPGDN
ncbi:MAG: radical SAM protein [Nitrospira sp.]|nr:radical SAM protein [Candidatus Manganitrophaceae bacterium]HIL35326.1 radical SAM protein [Candidatus Manganitrophaceae bacterium]